MTTADGSSHPIRTWLAHHHTHASFLVCVALTAYVSSLMGVDRDWFWLSAVFLLIVLLLWFVTGSAEITHDHDYLCERCATKHYSLDPSVEVGRERFSLRTFHYCRGWAWCLGPAFFVVTFISAWLVVPLWLLCIFGERVFRTHRRLFPWCPWCRNDGGGDDHTHVGPPTPTLVGARRT
jgi:hypothetical protein